MAVAAIDEQPLELIATETGAAAADGGFAVIDVVTFLVLPRGHSLNNTQPLPF